MTSCGDLIARQCRTALEQLDGDIPTVIPVVTDATGALLLEVRVSVDGELMTSRIDGRGMPVDPGMHEFSFSTDRGQVHTEKVLILQGQRNRAIAVQLAVASAALPPPAAPLEPGTAPPASASLEPAPPAPPPLATDARPLPAASADGERPPSIVPYVVGGAGLVAIGSSFLIAHWGSNDYDLLDRCAPACNPDSVTHVKRLYVAADVMLGLGVLGLGTGTWLYFTESKSEKPPNERAYRLDLRPIASGVVARFRKAF